MPSSSSSHDRFFLDTVVTRITEVGLKTLTTYTGTYSEYLTEREERLERLRERKRRQDEDMARIRAFVDRFRYQATKASQVQSRVKMLEKMTPIEVPPERKRVHFSFPACPKSGRLVLDLHQVRKAYGDTLVFRHAYVHIERGDRIALIGHNGAGKSTLMRLLSGVEPPDAGTQVEGHHVVMQYFAQDEAARLDPSLTVFATLASGSPIHMVSTIRNILGGFLFSGDDVHKQVGVLSGGERTRLAVARMLLRPSNTLLLDEPTTHLDIDSTNVLLDALTDFGGTLVFVSHDRYFLDRLATKIIEVGHGDAVLYPGTYEEFSLEKGEDRSHRAGRPRGQSGPPRRCPMQATARPTGGRSACDRDNRRGAQAGASRDAQRQTGDCGAPGTDRTAGTGDCGSGAGDQEARGIDGGARLLPRPRRRPPPDRPAPGTHVGSWWPDARVGGAADERDRAPTSAWTRAWYVEAPLTQL